MGIVDTSLLAFTAEINLDINHLINKKHPLAPAIDFNLEQLHKYAVQNNTQQYAQSLLSLYERASIMFFKEMEDLRFRTLADLNQKMEWRKNIRENALLIKLIDKALAIDSHSTYQHYISLSTQIKALKDKVDSETSDRNLNNKEVYSFYEQKWCLDSEIHNIFLPSFMSTEKKQKLSQLEDLKQKITKLDHTIENQTKSIVQLDESIKSLESVEIFLKWRLSNVVILKIRELQKQLTDNFPAEIKQYRQQDYNYTKKYYPTMDRIKYHSDLIKNSAPFNDQIELHKNLLSQAHKELETLIPPKLPENLPVWAKRNPDLLCFEQHDESLFLFSFTHCVDLIICYEKSAEQPNQIEEKGIQLEQAPIVVSTIRSEDLIEDIEKLSINYPDLLIIDQIYAEIRDQVNTQFPERDSHYPFSIKGPDPLNITYKYNRNFLLDEKHPQLYSQINRYLMQKLQEIKGLIAQNNQTAARTSSLALLNNNNDVMSDENLANEIARQEQLDEIQKGQSQEVKSPEEILTKLLQKYRSQDSTVKISEKQQENSELNNNNNISNENSYPAQKQPQNANDVSNNTNKHAPEENSAVYTEPQKENNVFKKSEKNAFKLSENSYRFPEVPTDEPIGFPLIPLGPPSYETEDRTAEFN